MASCLATYHRLFTLCYRLFYRVTVQLPYRDVCTNMDNYIARIEWKIKVGRVADELHARTTHCQLMRRRIASDNAIASIKNKRALRRVFHFYYDNLSLEGRLSAINIRSLLNRRMLSRSSLHIWCSWYFVTSSAILSFDPIILRDPVLRFTASLRKSSVESSIWISIIITIRWKLYYKIVKYQWLNRWSKRISFRKIMLLII